MSNTIDEIRALEQQLEALRGKRRMELGGEYRQLTARLAEIQAEMGGKQKPVRAKAGRPGGRKPGQPPVRERITQVLAANPGGLTRGQIVVRLGDVSYHHVGIRLQEMGKAGAVTRNPRDRSYSLVAVRNATANETNV